MVYSLAFSLPGTPALFYGEDIGMNENPRDRGAPQRALADAVVRPATRRVLHRGRRGGAAPACRRRRALRAAAVNVARQRREDGSLLNWFERLIRRRRGCAPRSASASSRSSMPACLGPRPPLRLGRLNDRGYARAGRRAVTVALALDGPAMPTPSSTCSRPTCTRSTAGMWSSCRAPRLSVAARPARETAAAALVVAEVGPGGR
jgi:hypothetical protein